MANDKLISAEDLDLQTSDEIKTELNLRAVRDRAERFAVIQALELADRNMSKTAKLLGISRPTLYDLINRHSIDTDKESMD